MIITEDTPQSPDKSNREIGRGGQADGESSAPPPPPYQPSPTAPNPNPAYHWQPPEATQSQSQPLLTRRESPESRFFRALAVALLIWLLFIGFTSSVANLATLHPKGRKHQVGGGDDRVVVPPPEDGDPIKCTGQRTEWIALPNAPSNSKTDHGILQAFPYHSDTTFGLPADQKGLSVTSHGPLSSGFISIISSNDDKIKVRITAGYLHHEALRRVNVCRVDSEHGIGIGIYTDTGGSWSAYDQISFEIEVSIPRSRYRNKPRLIPRFWTDLPNFSHYIDVEDGVRFGIIGLKGSNRDVNSQHLEADSLTIRTSNAPIQGAFNVTDSILLSTTSALIKVDTTLHNSGRTPTTMKLKSTNGPVDASIAMSSTGLRTPSYKVDATTSNSHLDVVCRELPNDATLKFDGSTSNSPARLSLPPAFEGDYSLQSSTMSPALTHSEAEDPKGWGRKRHIDINKDNIRGTITGRVYWDYFKSERGAYAKLKTTNSQAKLDLGPSGSVRSSRRQNGRRNSAGRRGGRGRS